MRNADSTQGSPTYGNMCSFVQKMNQTRRDKKKEEEEEEGGSDGGDHRPTSRRMRGRVGHTVCCHSPFVVVGGGTRNSAPCTMSFLAADDELF